MAGAVGPRDNPTLMSEVDFLVGKTVQEVRYSAPGNLRIVFDEGERVEPAMYADVGPFTYLDGSGRTHFVDATDSSSVAPVLAVAGRKVVGADTSGAVLQVEFDDGSTVRCEPHEGYEAWQVVGGSPQWLVIAGSDGPDDLIVYES